MTFATGAKNTSQSPILQDVLTAIMSQCEKQKRIFTLSAGCTLQVRSAVQLWLIFSQKSQTVCSNTIVKIPNRSSNPRRCSSKKQHYNKYLVISWKNQVSPYQQIIVWTLKSRGKNKSVKNIPTNTYLSIWTKFCDSNELELVEFWQLMRGCDGVKSVGQWDGDILVESLGVKDGDDGGSDSLNWLLFLLIDVNNGCLLFWTQITGDVPPTLFGVEWAVGGLTNPWRWLSLGDRIASLKLRPDSFGSKHGVEFLRGDETFACPDLAAKSWARSELVGWYLKKANNDKWFSWKLTLSMVVSLIPYDDFPLLWRYEMCDTLPFWIVFAVGSRGRLAVFFLQPNVQHVRHTSFLDTKHWKN